MTGLIHTYGQRALLRASKIVAREPIVFSKVEVDLADRASLGVFSALQYTSAATIHAACAAEMCWLTVCKIVAKLVDYAPLVGFEKRVSGQLGLLLLRGLLRQHHRRELLLKLRIRDLRVRYLVSQFSNGKFDIGVSRRLRRAEQVLELGDEVDRAVGVPKPLTGQIEALLKQCRINAHGEIVRRPSFKMQSEVST